jgi:hypothetical protein
LHTANVVVCCLFVAVMREREGGEREKERDGVWQGKREHHTVF